MQRRRRLRITPTPVRELPSPDDPGLPDVAPRPEPEPERRPPEPPEPPEPNGPDLPAPVPKRDPRDCLASAPAEPHLWAVMQAQIDADRRRRAAFVAARRPNRPVFAPDSLL
ncbi:hypothetical protein SAMN02745121_05994 [Nannocystis exedens]|uniref:Uncharacterized protein n=1 Tax=Nannocystis exedens TaxID=54 RepID=A0A1I2EBZ4_9BACT|nr:hypothetical protein [Nannocystis exedens]PCC74827.1 hypothetical protein NAEX_07927 [Nannocystis exedens]SFE90187.1 hypothetical protein SAMN02745121_05994 [Nannocystis exedens]